MNKAMYSLYNELLREAREYRVSISVLSRFSKKMEKAKHGKADFSEVVVSLIREIEKSIRGDTRGGNRESALASMTRKRVRFCELQKEAIYKGK